MQGFDTKALLLFPKIENYENKSGSYKYQFKTALNNVISYLKSIGIEPHAFYTDDVAREIRHSSFVWVSPLGKADRFFLSKHCADCGDAISTPMIEYDEVYNDILAKDPGSLDMSINDRFEMVLRHTAKAVSKIIPQYKIVVHFSLANKAQYKVTSKPNDGKIRIIVNASTFQPKVLMGGVEENACDILGVPYASRGLDLWEVN